MAEKKLKKKSDKIKIPEYHSVSQQLRARRRMFFYLNSISDEVIFPAALTFMISPT